MQYQKSMRNPPGELQKQNMSITRSSTNQNMEYDKDKKDPFYTKDTTARDWCSGAFAHFDLDHDKTANKCIGDKDCDSKYEEGECNKEAGCTWEVEFRDDADTGTMEFKRISCPDIPQMNFDGCCMKGDQKSGKDYCNANQTNCSVCSGQWYDKCPLPK